MTVETSQNDVTVKNRKQIVFFISLFRENIIGYLDKMSSCLVKLKDCDIKNIEDESDQETIGKMHHELDVLINYVKDEMLDFVGRHINENVKNITLKYLAGKYYTLNDFIKEMKIFISKIPWCNSQIEFNIYLDEMNQRIRKIILCDDMIKRIQQNWTRCYYDPLYKVCKKRLSKEFKEMIST